MVDLSLIATALKEAGRADLQVELLELSEKLREKEEQIRTLEEENRSLREASDLKARVHVRDEMYYVRQDDGTEDGPFCTQCCDSDGKLISLQCAVYSRPRCPKCQLNHGSSKGTGGGRLVRG